MTRTIELSDATYERLLRHIESFEETPDDVVRRILDERDKTSGHYVDAVSRNAVTDDVTPGHANRTERAAPGSILPEREYWRPILEFILEQGGAAPANDVIEEVGRRLRDRLTDMDYEQLDMGETRWRNRARFARLRMREQGLLSASSHRGIWEITARGRQYLKRPGSP